MLFSVSFAFSILLYCLVPSQAGSVLFWSWPDRWDGHGLHLVLLRAQLQHQVLPTWLELDGAVRPRAPLLLHPDGLQ